MTLMRGLSAVVAAAMVFASGPSWAGRPTGADGVQASAARTKVTVATRQGPRNFTVELARTGDEQERGLMFRTDLPADGGMLFAPYPGEGGGPREASFWMKNTPSPLDILFIRPDGTIAAIAANVAPFSEDPHKSGEPVSAVLEINGGKAAEFGIAPGDKVTWSR